MLSTNLNWFCWFAILLSFSSVSIRLLSSKVISFTSANLQTEVEFFKLHPKQLIDNSWSKQPIRSLKKRQIYEL